MTAADLILGKGIAFPPRIDAGGRLQWSVGEASIHDAIAIILGTSPGERIALPRFGAGLDRFLFDANNAGTHARIADAIAAALKAAEPRIALESITVDADPASTESAAESAIAVITWRLVASGARSTAAIAVPVGGA